MTDTLTDRLAQADKPTRELLGEVFAAVFREPPQQSTTTNRPRAEWLTLRYRFTAMLDAEAWTSAVEMLVPASVDRYPQAYYIGPNPNESRVGHRWELWTKDCRGKPFRGHHINSSSLALAIACLKARGL